MGLLKLIFGEKMPHKCSIHSVTLPNFIYKYGIKKHCKGIFYSTTTFLSDLLRHCLYLISQFDCKTQI